MPPRPASSPCRRRAAACRCSSTSSRPRCSSATRAERDLVGLEGSSTLTRLLEAQAALLLRPMALRVQVRSFESVCRAVEAKPGIGVLPLAAAGSFAGAMGLTVEPLADAWALRAVRLCTRTKPDAKSALGALVGHLKSLAD